jgi:hypothetical protein
MNYENIQVECYSGYKINERWYEGGTDPTRPEISYLKVKTIEDRIFILRYLSLFDSWPIGV